MRVLRRNLVLRATRVWFKMRFFNFVRLFPNTQLGWSAGVMKVIIANTGMIEQFHSISEIVYLISHHGVCVYSHFYIS